MSTTEQPLVSLITPTMDWERFLALQYECFLKHDYPNLEWLVHDGSEEPSAILSNLEDSRVKYFHEPGRLSIGAKKALLLPHVRGEIIMNIDDDDYYAPHYVQTMVEVLNQGYDLVKLDGFYLYSTVYGRLGYWDLGDMESPCQIWSDKSLKLAVPDAARKDLHEGRYWGYGFNYAYRREVAEAVGFPDLTMREDLVFVQAAREVFNCHAFPDEEGLVLHVLHNSNTSSSFPQFPLPNFLLGKVFPAVPRGFLAQADAHSV